MKHLNNETLGYASPDCEIHIIKSEGVLCGSGDDMEFNSTLDGYVQKDETYW